MANIADMELPAATESDWYLDGNVLNPMITTLQTIPKACTAFVTHVTCGCKKTHAETTNSDASKLHFPVQTCVRVAMTVLTLSVIHTLFLVSFLTSDNFHASYSPKLVDFK